MHTHRPTKAFRLHRQSMEVNKVSHCKKIGYNINVLQQTACMVVNPITLAALLSSLISLQCSGLDLRLYDGSDLKVYLLDFFCSSVRFCLLLSPYLCFISFFYLVLYVLGDDALKI